MPRKLKPLYEQIQGNGEINSLDFSDKRGFLFNNNAHNWENNKLLMSPYTEYIPLLYLLSTGSRIVRNDGAQTNYKAKFKSRNLFFNFFSENYNQKDKNLAVKYAINSINNWLNYDEAVRIDEVIRKKYGSRYKDYYILEAKKEHAAFHQRSYKVFSSLYSMFLKPLNVWNAPNPILSEWSPHVLAVVLPENFLYLKYKLLTENILDLSKVIILVDNQLDTAQFYKQPFRKLYKEMMLPEIMKTGCQIWKVPKEFIEENCFIQPFSMKGMPITERRRVIQELLEDFKKSGGKTEVKDPQMTWEYVTNQRIVEQFGNDGNAYTYTIGVDPIRNDDRVMALAHSLAASEQITAGSMIENRLVESIDHETLPF